MKIGVTGGGTGGHVIPIKSLIHYINQTDKFKSKIKEIVWFGEENGLEKQIFNEINNHDNTISLKFEAIQGGKLRRSLAPTDIIKNIKDIYNTIKGVIKSYKKVKESKINILFSKGGYVSLPVVISCRLQKIPIIIHESDIHAGLTSKISSYFTKNILTGFPGVLKHSTYIGQIVHPDLAKFTDIDINDKKTHILVNGGSSGAKSIYDFINQYESKIPKSIHFHIITGFRNTDHGIKNSEQITIYGFCGAHEMQQLYSICDITITRGGVTSLFEQDLFGIKMIMIPLSITHDQELNCKYYEQLGKGHTIVIQRHGRQHQLEKHIEENKNFRKANIDKNDIRQKVIYGVDQVATRLIQDFN